MRNKWTRKEYKQIMEGAKSYFYRNYESVPYSEKEAEQWMRDGIFVEMAKRLKKFDFLAKVQAKLCDL
jgi:hypothetical protein